MNNSRYNEPKWLYKFSIAKQYYQEFGNLRIPDKITYKNEKMGSWIYWQRKNYKDVKLSNERIEKLNSIGMIWDKAVDYNELWEENFAVALKFKKEFNTLLIPTNFEYMNINIGKWISYQRQRYKKNKMPEYQIKKLEDIGMIWDASNNNISTSFPEQALFYYIQLIFKDAINRFNEYGFELDIYIPSIRTGIEYDGFLWHKNNSRDELKNKKCKNNNIKLIRIRENGLPLIEENEHLKIFYINRGYSDLENVIHEVLNHLNCFQKVKVDLIKDKNKIIKEYINIYNKHWEDMFNLAEKYYVKTGTLVGIKDNVVNGWITHQRSRYNGKRNPLTDEQIKKLESIGMVWDVYKNRWENNFKIAQKYYEENGNLNVSNSTIYKGINLGQWITAQRSVYKSGKLSSKRINKLDSIEMIWDASINYDELWENNFELAKDYYKEYGNLLIPIRDEYKGKMLGKWINSQRSKYNQLEDYKIEKLESIGMVWNVFNMQWEEMYIELKKYYNEYGNILVPYEYEVNGKLLGRWLNRQAINKKDLSKEQILKLNNLGMNWKRNITKWDKMYELAKEYYKENGNLNVDTHSSYKGENLGYWINHQRNSYRLKNTDKANTEFSEERIKKLNSIGMIWNVAEAKWEYNYSILKEYYEKNGNIDISSSLTIDGVKIGKWLENQKSSYHGYKGRRKLKDIEIKKLNDLNIKW